MCLLRLKTNNESRWYNRYNHRTPTTVFVHSANESNPIYVWKN